MHAVLLPGNKDAKVVERPDPTPGLGDVLVRTRASAICRSDMSLYDGNPIVGGDAARTGQVVPGHEPAGDVVAIGDGVRGVRPGDRVAIYLALGCGRCRYCRHGYLMLCPDWKCLGFDLDGGDADYLVVPAANCLALPDEISYEVGALTTDMIGTQYHTQKRLEVFGGSTLAVFGLGPMGATAVLVGKARGATVVAVDVLDTRLELARELGADACVNGARDDAVMRVHGLTDGEGADVAIDCSGTPAGENGALDCVRKLGSVAFVGETRSATINPSEQFIRKQLRVIGGWYFPISEYPDIARFVVDHQIPVERLITHRFALRDAAEAFRMFDQRLTEKAVFVWD